MDLLALAGADAAPARSRHPRTAAATSLSRLLASRRPLTRLRLREAMTAAYGGPDTAGAWTWKDAYDASEVALAENLLRTGAALIAGDPASVLGRLDALAALLPSHRLRTEEGMRLQQFSTPPAYAYAAFLAAEITAGDLVLEPSAGHGALGVFAKIAGADLMLNEIDGPRAGALGELFGQDVSRVDSAHIDDLLTGARAPSVVLMNPPFAKSVTRGDHDGEAAAHVWSAFKRLAPGGRLVAIVQHGLKPGSDRHAAFWGKVSGQGTLRLAAGVDGAVYGRMGTSVSTRLLVIDKTAGDVLSADICECDDIAGLIARLKRLPSRAIACTQSNPEIQTPLRRRIDRKPQSSLRKPQAPIVLAARRSGEEIAYEILDAAPATIQGEELYSAYRIQRLRIEGAHDHPTPLTQSAALASVLPPIPSYRPHLPRSLVTLGVLSDAQLESVIYAGEAHSRFMDGYFVRHPETGEIREAREGEAGVFRLRMGYFIGDGTGCGKGRQLAGIIMDNWIKGRRKAVWISKSDKLLEDAIRDWTALGGAAPEIIPQSRTKLGRRIAAFEGVLFTTFATLRVGSRDGKASRLDQLLEWLGDDFEGVIAFDEAHAMQNAAASKTDRGVKAASLQGKAGVDLQMRAPGARIVYASATGASAVENLAYGERLGLWRGSGAPFASKQEFIAEMNKGGVAAMEMVCRDLKAMGLYCARSLSFEGVEYEFLDHELTPAQIEIYDAYASAFKVIHNNLEKALEAMGVTEGGVSKNRNAVSAARSAFEGTKQRFFNHLLTAMKMPALIAALRKDRKEGFASLIQIVSTGEAVMERALAELSAADLADGNFDATPRQAVMEYLVSSFPTQLHRIVADENGNETAEPVFDSEGNPVESREAVRLREGLVERLCALPPVTAALDQLIWAFGADEVAEITGRRRRVVRHRKIGGERIEIENRPASVGIAETNAFMDGRKSILVFSEAGGTGLSYHADKSRKNQMRRHHYLLEGGWKADAAVQGLGRSHRTRQACPPLFIPVRTNVKGEKRFLSTIARRLDALGALTRGERATGGQGLFRAADNLESREAQEALLIFFRRLAKAPQGGISLQAFTDMTGLKIVDKDGTVLEQLPPIRRFLNRLLALPIAMQNTAFGVFEEIIDNRVEAAIAAGTLDLGAETITADSMRVLDEHVLRRDPATGAETKLIRIARRTRNRPRRAGDVIERYGDAPGRYFVNEKSGRAAYIHETTPITDEDTGAVFERVELIRPNDRERMIAEKLGETAWDEVSKQRFLAVWEAEVAATPEFSSDEFGLVTGLILPLWSLLAEKRPIVYRLTDDDGASHLGRYVAPAMIAPLLAACGVAGGGAAFTAASALAALMRDERVSLASDAFLTRSKVMDRLRIEVRDYAATWLDGLKAAGCFTEIVNWRTRVFVPDDRGAEEIVERILVRYGATQAAVATTGSHSAAAGNDHCGLSHSL